MPRRWFELTGWLAGEHAHLANHAAGLDNGYFELVPGNQYRQLTIDHLCVRARECVRECVGVVAGVVPRPALSRCPFLSLSLSLPPFPPSLSLTLLPPRPYKELG